MNNNIFMKLANQSLPFDMPFSEIKQYAPDSLWRSDSIQAFKLALESCPRLNWTSYLANYPDVLKAGINPMSHFLENGLYEGRQLYSYHPLRICGRQYDNAPKITVIVPNYNNAIFLEKCLSSLVTQTLPEIEVIIVDDGSQDDSLEIITQFTQNYKNFKLVRHKLNMSLHMARKTGVANAIGDYIMFLDPDDFYSADACEVAYHAAIKGYDIVQFSVAPINLGGLSVSAMEGYERWYNSYPYGYHSQNEIIYDSLIAGTLSHSVCHKIFDRYICQYAFAQTESNYFPLTEDFYEFMIIVMSIRNFYKINDKLYNCTRGQGLSSFDSSAGRIMRRRGIGKLLAPINKFLDGNKLSFLKPSMKKILFSSSIRYLLDFNPVLIESYLEVISEQYGILYTITNLLSEYDGRKDSLLCLLSSANEFKPKCRCLKKNSSCKLGLIITHLNNSIYALVLLPIIKLLASRQIQVVIFTNQTGSFLEAFRPYAEIYSIIDYRDDIKEKEIYLEQLYRYIKESGIGMMLIYDINNPTILWDILLVHLLKLPVVGILDDDIACEFIKPRDRGYNHRHWLNMLKYMDRVIVHSTVAETYLQIQGVECQRVEIPKKNSANLIHLSTQKNILLMGNIGNGNHQTKEAFLVFREVLKLNPDVFLIVAGTFASQNAMKTLSQWVRNSGMESKIRIIDNKKNIKALLDDASILLSTSFTNNYTNGIELALAQGIQCVAYDIPALRQYAGKNLVLVPQGKYEKAAGEINRLLMRDDTSGKYEDPDQIRVQTNGKANWSSDLLEAITSCGHECKINYREPADYGNVLDSLAFYGGKSIPKTWPA